MQLFAEQHLSEYLDNLKNEMEKEILREAADKLLNQDEAAYIEYLVKKNTIEPLVFKREELFAEQSEQVLRTSDTWRGYPRDPTEYRRQVFEYHLPFTGEETLLPMQPNKRLVWSVDVSVKESNHLCFQLIDRDSSSTTIKREADTILTNIDDQNQNVTQQVGAYNAYIESRAREVLQKRKQEILAQRAIHASLGVPVRRAGETSRSYQVPIKRKSVVIKPDAPAAPFKPEWALEESVFDEILEVVHDFGKNMEQHPSIYEGKGEEALRDLLIMQLSPHFQSTTGETFNRNGKTDILIKHEKENVFVAECKFWNGGKGFLKTIDQCLNYLTWRESKAAVINFVRNANLQPALDEIKSSLPTHQCYVSGLNESKEGLVRCNMRLPKDMTRGVKFAVLSFHLPEK